MTPGQSNGNSGSNLVRWILVVTLGCSLGLLFIYAVLSTGTLSRRQEIPVVVRVIPQVREAEFKPSEDAVGEELTRIIKAQLAAFRKDDYPEAYRYAATGLKEQVPLPAFERMVKNGFPVIAQSRAVQFGVIIDNGEQAVVNAVIEDKSDRERHYQYSLLREPAGWKISGVSEVRPTGTTL